MTDLLVGLRGVALLLIVAAELSAAGLLSEALVSGLDEVGIMLIVVISGFVHGVLHLHQRCDGRAVAAFAARRARRVLPAYAVAVALSFALAGWWEAWPWHVDSTAAGIRTVLLLDAPGALWIVPVLVQCYAVFVVVWWLRSKRTPTWQLGVFTAGAVIPAIAGWYPESGHGLAVVLPAFVAGLWCGSAWTSRVGPFLVAHPRALSILGGLAFVLVFVNVPAVRIDRGWALGQSVAAATWFDPVSLVIVVTLVLAAGARPVALAVLGMAPLRLLGRGWLSCRLVIPVLLAALPAAATLG